MPSSQVLPVTEVDKVGLVYDRPAPSLPHNAFSDAQNVRFKDGTIRKMQGEVNIFPNLFDDNTNLIDGIAANFDGGFIKYVVFWPNPNIIGDDQGYYLVINEETRTAVQKDVAYLVSVDGSQKVEKGIFTPAEDGAWQHTFFQGGFALIINNGLDVPHYILDGDGNTDINAIPSFLQLPGWESYNVNEIALQDTFNPNEDSYIFDCGQNVDFDINEIVVERINSSAPTTVVPLTAKGDTGVDGTPNNPAWTPPDFSTLVTTPWTVADEYEIYYDSTSGTTVLNFPNNLSTSPNTDTITVTIRSRNAVEVRARVVRAFGDFLVAGDLTERDEVDPNTIVRALPGVVRTSDTAAPGSVPNNWNPFAAGVSTADEFTVSETSSVTDMVELQGNLYIYTSSNISVMRNTGNAAIPVSISSVTDSYGCQTTNAVLEFEGKHVVVGSKDVYLFAGNPGSIQSIADGVVRRYLFSNVNPQGTRRVFLIDNQQREEIWVCYPSISSNTGDCDEALIWSYRNMTWTRRELRGVISGTLGPIPGGGLPFADVDLTGTSGDNGVTHVGAYEVRTIGIDSTLTFPNEHLVYTGTPTGLMYGTGRWASTYRTNDTFYIERVLPSINITGPEGIDIDYTFTDPTPGTLELTAQEMWDQIQTQLEAMDGWTFATLPSGYSQETGTVRLIATEDGVGDGVDGLRDVAPTIQFDVTVTDAGSSNVSNSIASDLFMKDSTAEADIFGVTVSGTVNDYRGSYVKRATPTVMGIQLLAPKFTGGEEMIFLTKGDTGDYNPVDHTGSTNGIAYTDEQTAEAWIDAIRLATSDIDAIDGGTAGEFSIQPTAFSATSAIIGDIRINENSTDADWLWSKYQETVAGTIGNNPYSSTVFANPVNLDGTVAQALDVASNAPAIAGSLDTQFTPDVSRTPDRTGSDTAATMTSAITVSSLYDVDRPWYTDKINPNLEFPIFASRMRVDGPSSRPSISKIVAADVGWTVPLYDYNPRVETADPANFSVVITNNDAPISYESYVERKQMNISPDLDTETVHQLTLWASGSYKQYVNADNVYNRLQVRYSGTDNSGKEVDLTTLTPPEVKKNNFFISESHKADTRLHGRYLNYRITDEILDDNDNVLEMTSNTKRSTSTVFTQDALWEISGMQPEINKGGRR